MSQTFKKKELRTLGNLAEKETLQCNDLKRTCYDLIIDSVFTELFKPNTKKSYKHTKYIIPI